MPPSLKDQILKASSSQDLLTLIQRNASNPDIVFCLDSPFADESVHNRVQDERAPYDEGPALTVRWFDSHPAIAIHVMCHAGADKYAPLMTQEQLRSARYLGQTTAIQARLLQYHTVEGHAEAAQRLPKEMDAWLNVFPAKRNRKTAANALSPHYFFQHHADVLLAILPAATIYRLIEGELPLIQATMIHACWATQEKKPELRRRYPTRRLQRHLDNLLLDNRTVDGMPISDRSYMLNRYRRMLLSLASASALQEFTEQLIIDIEDVLDGTKHLNDEWRDAAASAVTSLLVHQEPHRHLDLAWVDRMLPRIQRSWPLTSPEILSAIVLDYIGFHEKNPSFEPLPISETTLAYLVGSTDPALRKAVVLGMGHLRIVNPEAEENVVATSVPMSSRATTPPLRR